MSARVAGRDVPCDGERRRKLGEIGRVHGEAVHRRVREGGNGKPRRERFGQDASERSRQRDGAGGERASEGFDQSPVFVGAQRRGHVALLAVG